MNKFKWVFILVQVSIVLSGQDKIPGIVVGHSHPDTKAYVGSPRLSSWRTGVRTNDTQTNIAESTNRGNSWKTIARIKRLAWANLFTHNSDLYIIGTQDQTGGYGPLVFRKSTDLGRTWTEPVDEEYHTGPMPMIIQNGRIFRAGEDRNPPEEWGVNFRSLIISAPVDADLMKAASWTTSNRLRYNQEWHGRAWLEGNVVITPQGEIVNILRNDTRPEGGKACIINVSKYGTYKEYTRKIKLKPTKIIIV